MLEINERVSGRKAIAAAFRKLQCRVCYLSHLEVLLLSVDAGATAARPSTLSNQLVLHLQIRPDAQQQNIQTSEGADEDIAKSLDYVWQANPRLARALMNPSDL